MYLQNSFICRGLLVVICIRLSFMPSSWTFLWVFLEHVFPGYLLVGCSERKSSLEHISIGSCSCCFFYAFAVSVLLFRVLKPCWHFAGPSSTDVRRSKLLCFWQARKGSCRGTSGYSPIARVPLVAPCKILA